MSLYKIIKDKTRVMQKKVITKRRLVKTADKLKRHQAMIPVSMATSTTKQAVWTKNLAHFSIPV